MSDQRMQIDQAHAGKTIAAIVRQLQPDVPWSRAKKWCLSGRVRVDGDVVRDPATRVTEGATVDLGAPQRDTTGDIPMLFVDREIVVVEKPAGLVTVPYTKQGDHREPRTDRPGPSGADTDTLRHRVQAQLRRRFGPVPPPRVVQRLDRETSGVLVFARTRRAERALQSQLKAHDVEREYMALCWGRVGRHKFDTMLVRDRGDRRRGTSTRAGRPESGAKRAITHVEPREYFDAHDVSLVSCRLETGRQHQIRIHLAEAGHPLLGERVYLGPLGIDRAAWSKDHSDRHEAWGVSRTMLHAGHLGIRHPSTEEAVRFDADPPADFAAVLQRLRGA